MSPDHRDTKTHPPADRERDEHERADAEREPRQERDRRIGATQMAAPSTRRWRRAGRFTSS